VSEPIDIEIEGRLRFTFERPTWEAVKWDDDPAYLHGLRRHDAKAVDILATLGRRGLHLFEVKDPRGSEVENRDRVPDEELARIVAEQVRDTIAGLVFARDRHPGEHLQVHLQTLFVGRSERVNVIFWLEAPGLEQARAITLATLIERNLRWLKPNVLVTSRALWPGRPGLTVESMHGAPWRG
jgi:hypothetical protein